MAEVVVVEEEAAVRAVEAEAGAMAHHRHPVLAGHKIALTDHQPLIHNLHTADYQRNNPGHTLPLVEVVEVGGVAAQVEEVPAVVVEAVVVEAVFP